MAAYFSGTLTALKKGVTKMSISAAIRNIENWEDSLQDVELTGCRAILRDLGALKKQLQDDEPDGERIRHLMAKLASQTVAVSEKADTRYSDKIANLGEMLADAAESAEDDDESDDNRTKAGASKAKSTGGNDAHDASGKFAKGNQSGRSSQSSSKNGRDMTDEDDRSRDEDGRYAKSDGDGRHARSR
jgi:hypothetical protein